jgi:hypothetical protein
LSKYSRPNFPSSVVSRRAATLALAATGACSNGAAPPAAPPGNQPPAPAATPGRTAVLAPIESADLVVRESEPPQYAVRIVSGLPSGCAKFERVDVARDGYVVNVTVWNTVPADPGLACTMIYGTTEHTAELGSTFTRGETFAVHVNGESKLSFTLR